MNEISLSSDLNVITAEINSYKQIAGQSIFEIGKRLKHVKENDLVHGEFGKWLESVDMNDSYARKFMTVYEELGDNRSTLNTLGMSALYQIATLPEPEREKEHTLETGVTKKPDEMTVRELQEVKKQLKQKNEEIEQLKNRPVETIEKEITIERIPEDYDKIKGGYQALERNKAFYEEQNADLREEIKQLEGILKNTPKNDNSHELVKKEIDRLKEEKKQLVESTSSLKHVKNLQEKIEELTTELSPIRYSNDLKVLSENRELLLSFEESLLSVEKWIKEIKEELPNKNIIEGDFKNE